MGDNLTLAQDPVLTMETFLLSFVISIFIGLVVLILVYLALMGLKVWVVERALRSPGRSIRWVEQIRPILGYVPIPEVITHRWLSEIGTSRLVHSGMRWSARDFAAFRWLLLLGSIVCAILLVTGRGWDLVGGFLAIVTVAAGYFAPRIWLDLQIGRRQMEIDNALAPFMDRMTLGLDAGLGFEAVLRRIAGQYPGLLGEEFRRMVRQLDRGHPRWQALEELGERNSSHDLSAFVAAVRQTDRLGTSLARILRIQTHLLRSRRRRRAEEASRRLPILIVFPLVFFFLPALLIIYLAPPILHIFLGR